MRRALGVAAVLAALGAAVVIGVIGGRVAPKPERITVSSDTYALTAEPSVAGGMGGTLIAGGVAGGAAITYLKFDVVLPNGTPPQRAWLWLGLAGSGAELPELIEVSAIPQTDWKEDALTAANAPRL